MPDSEDTSLTWPAEILASRRWETALFTTYAFSVSFFESVILRELQKGGCREVWVLTDVEGYATSLIERRATKVGRDYRLIPILAPNGVFHPKCAYLSSSHGDLLLVGSGNLTFGGYGRNVEVLDVLAPEAHPTAFRDFANFLEALGTRPDLAVPETAWVSSFANMARRASDSSKPDGSNSAVRLLHSVERPIVKQIAEVCAQHGGAERITVLSPFHDPDGSAVLALARATQCSEICIGMPPDPNQLSTFPFPTGHRWGLRLSAVRPRVDDASRRPLHAKWIEIKTPTGVLTITGSINATTAALCSTRNIEIGVVRSQGFIAHEWEGVPIPADFERKPFSPGLAARKFSVHTSLLGSGEIRGQIMPSAGVLGQWKLKLERLGNVLADLPVDVDESGTFRITFLGSERLIEAGSIRITVRQADKEGAGWLEMPIHHRWRRGTRRRLHVQWLGQRHPKMQDGFRGRNRHERRP